MHSKNTVVLDTQYRMEKTIGTLISCLFYDGKLKNGRNNYYAESLLWVDYSPSRIWPEPNEDSSDKPLIFNRDECEIIKELLNGIDEQTNENRDNSFLLDYTISGACLSIDATNIEAAALQIRAGSQNKAHDRHLFCTTLPKRSSCRASGGSFALVYSSFFIIHHSFFIQLRRDKSF